MSFKPRRPDQYQIVSMWWPAGRPGTYRQALNEVELQKNISFEAWEYGEWRKQNPPIEL